MRRCCDIMSLALQALPKDEKAGKIHWRQVGVHTKGCHPPRTGRIQVETSFRTA